MNRNEFIADLEKELLDISSEERENALLYYKDYFDDAGVENEDEVMKELSSPKVIAQEIKRDLGLAAGSQETNNNQNTNSTQSTYTRQDTTANDAGSQGSYQYQNASGSSKNQNASGTSANSSNGKPGEGKTIKEFFLQNLTFGSITLPVWALVLIAILFFPVILPVVSGIFGTIIGVVFGAFGLAIGFFGASVGLIVGGLASVTYGIVTMVSGVFFNGLLIFGGGLFLLGLGLLMLVLSLKLCIVWLPKFIKWIIFICKKIFTKSPVQKEESL